MIENAHYRFNKNIRRPSQASSIRFYRYDTNKEVYMIDTSISGDITIQDDQLQILPQFTFEEKTRFYITFEREVVVSYEGEL